ncbi:MAG: response regulator transcription factor [Gammaproteobacteria bacterium]
MVGSMTRKTRILVVEDEPAIRTGLVDVLVFHGFEADSAEDGHEGLDKALRGGFDLILLDVMLPGMDGYAICNRIRAEDRDQLIIMLTAKTSDEDIIQGLSLGADDYMAKPFSIVQLVLRIKAVLRRSRIAVEMENHIRLGDDIGWTA